MKTLNSTGCAVPCSASAAISAQIASESECITGCDTERHLSNEDIESVANTMLE